MKKVIVLGLTAATLAGCNMIGGVSSPHRKPGLWEETRQGDRSPTPLVTRACFDEASDRRMPVLPRKPRHGPNCEKFSEAKDGDSYVVDQVCSRDGMKMTMHAVLAGDYSSRYTMTQTMDMEGNPDPVRNGQHKATLTAVYKGDCPPEIQPGQVQLPNGDVVSMAEMRRGFAGGERGGGNSASNSTGGGQSASNSAPAQ